MKRRPRRKVDERGQVLVDLLVAMGIMAVIGALIAPALLATTQSLSTLTTKATSAQQATQDLSQLAQAVYGAQPVGWCPSTPAAAPTGLADAYGPMTTPAADCPDPSEGPPGQPGPIFTYEPSNPAGAAGQLAPALPGLGSGWARSGQEAAAPTLLGFYATDFTVAPSPTGAPELVFAYRSADELLVVAFAPTCPGGQTTCPTDPTWSFSSSTAPCTAVVTNRTCLVVGTLVHPTAAPPLFSYQGASGALTPPFTSSSAQPSTITILVNLAFREGPKLVPVPYSTSTLIAGVVAQTHASAFATP